jgi:cholesterol oxidase
MKSHYDAIVIGTGFGGSVAACRLAQAGLQVGVFERGHRYPPKPFPRSFESADEWSWQISRGLFDVRAVSEITAVTAAGYGGGSLVYANVQMRPPQSAFEDGWPPGYSRDALASYYDLVAYMLDVKPITMADGLPPKARLIKDVASERGRDGQFFYPNLAINFGPRDVARPNRFGALQEGCCFCGECIIGCRTAAKNTLDHNYLKVAEDRGADINTDCEVMRIAPAQNGYRVIVFDHTNRLQVPAEAARVFLCAGSINSTELLLRCRDEYQSLPKLSAKLGHCYSGNGDFISFAFDTDRVFEPCNGPTITTATVYDRARAAQPGWFVLEDGGYPPELSRLVQLLHPKGALLEELAKAPAVGELRLALAAHAGTEVRGDPQHTAVFLLMGRDRANGVIKLKSPAPGIVVQWDAASSLPLYDIETGLSADFAASLKGHLELNPVWKILRIPVSVHNLGGCPMSSEPGLGVVDPFGEVFEYPGLYVLDGSILPAATGANPSQTIAAVAERNIEAAIRKIRSDPDWRAPEMQAALQNPVHEPLDDVTVPYEGTAPPRTSPIQLSFTETLRGFVAIGGRSDDYVAGERAGREAGTIAAMTLTITTPALDSFFADKRYSAGAQGVIKITGITPAEGAAVRNGVFNLFVATRDGHFYQRRMLYHIPFLGADGNAYALDGFKDVRDHGWFDVWGATTTLYSVIRAADGQVIACGIVKVHLQDFLKQLTTFKVSGTGSIVTRSRSLLRFYRLFIGTLYDLFVRPRMPGAV